MVSRSVNDWPRTRYGENIVTVGDGGQFDTVENALNFIVENAAAPTEVYAGQFGGTAGITQYDDIVTLTDADELNPFFTATRENSITEQIWVQLDDDGYYRAVDKLTSGTTFQLEAGYEQATTSGIDYKFYTMERWIVELLPGNHVIDQEVDMSGIRCGLTIRGAGRASTVLSFAATGFGVGGRLDPPAAGTFAMYDLTVIKTNATITIGNNPTEGVYDEKSTGLIVDLSNSNFMTMEGTQADILNIDCCKYISTGMDLGGKDNIIVVYTDSAYVNGMNFTSNTFSGASFGLNCNRWQCTKPFMVNGVQGFANGAIANTTAIVFCRKSDTVTGGTKEAYITGVQTTHTISIANGTGNTVGEMLAYIKDCTAAQITSNHATVYQTNVTAKDKTATTQNILNSGVFN